MATAFVKAAPERRVLNHQRGFREMLPEGESVELDATFRGYLADGDLIEVKDTSSPSRAKTKDVGAAS